MKRGGEVRGEGIEGKREGGRRCCFQLNANKAVKERTGFFQCTKKC